MDKRTLKVVDSIDIKIPGLKIIKKIGEGGMSVVYLAEQVSLRRKVAVKVMRLEIASNDVDVQRFKQEAKTIALLDHPNIINIYDIGQTSTGEIYFTMPYLNHGDFSSYILESEDEFIDLLKSICDGLGFAHERGIVHRDIKPENLLFDKFGNIRIADFGIALSKDGTRMTKEHQIVGSAQYMSPEQARSLSVEAQSDIYSLGIVIFERLTGEVPFDSDDSISILVNHVSLEPPKLSPKMRHWQGLIDKCLAKSAEDRYQTMQELKEALRNIPTSSLQRTNSSIQSLLSSDIKKHLTWFLPILVLLIGFAIYKNQKTPIKKIDQKPVTVAKIEKKPKVTVKKPPKQNTPIVLIKTKTSAPVTDFFSLTKAIDKDYYIPNSPLEFFNANQDVLPNNDIDQSIKFKQWPYDDFFVDVTLLDEINTSEINDIELLLSIATSNIKKYQLSRPRKNNATDQLLKVISLDPDNKQAIEGLNAIAQKYTQLVKSALSKKKYNKALKHVQSLKSFNDKLAEKTINLKQPYKEIFASIGAINTQNLSIKEIQLLITAANSIDSSNVVALNLSKELAKKQGPKIGSTLTDKLGNKTIIITSNFAVSPTEVTVKSYAQFSNQTNRAASRCKHKGGGINSFFNNKTWQKPYFPQNSNHPVVCISQPDAVAYTKWLSTKTGFNYRLPTKQEWSLVSQAKYNNFKPCLTGNLKGDEALKIKNKEFRYSCDDRYKFTAPVASFYDNKLKLYDIQGNVSEWLACDSTACQTTVAAGSSWYHGKQSNKLSHTEKFTKKTALSYIGFRIIREL